MKPLHKVSDHIFFERVIRIKSKPLVPVVGLLPEPVSSSKSFWNPFQP